jgi:hypothetical protein
MFETTNQIIPYNHQSTGALKTAQLKKRRAETMFFFSATQKTSWMRLKFHKVFEMRDDP